MVTIRTSAEKPGRGWKPKSNQTAGLLKQAHLWLMDVHAQYVDVGWTPQQTGLVPAHHAVSCMVYPKDTMHVSVYISERCSTVVEKLPSGSGVDAQHLSNHQPPADFTLNRPPGVSGQSNKLIGGADWFQTGHELQSSGCDPSVDLRSALAAASASAD